MLNKDIIKLLMQFIFINIIVVINEDEEVNCINCLEL